tara:strand:- start:536 stop:811 length:276 start_codon:yes stop_codon:yes gene_type:complete
MTIVKCTKKKLDDFEHEVNVEIDDLSNLAYLQININGQNIRIRCDGEDTRIETNSIEGTSLGSTSSGRNETFGDIMHHSITIRKVKKEASQ